MCAGIILKNVCIISNNDLLESCLAMAMVTVLRNVFCISRHFPAAELKTEYIIGLFCHVVEASWNVMAHAQKPDFVFRRNWRIYLNRRGRQFSRLLAAEVCASAVVMLDTPGSEVVWRVLATYSIRQFLLHFPPRGSACAMTFQLESNWGKSRSLRNSKEDKREAVFRNLKTEF